jgi:hypothetical protein
MSKDVASQNSRRRYAVGYTISALIVLLVIVAMLRTPPNVDRHDDSAMARGFMNALRLNNSRLAKSLVDPKQHARIDAWMAKHTVSSCPSNWKFWEKEFWDGEQEGGMGTQPAMDSTRADWSYGYSCFRAGYSFDVDDITLELKEREWQIVDWGKICESQNWREEKCE